MEQYVLVDFTCPDEGADTFDLYVSWADLKEILDLPRRETHIKEETKVLIQDYLDSINFIEYADNYELEEARVFFNIIPLIVNAAATIVPLIKDYCNPDSTEASFFITDS